MKITAYLKIIRPFNCLFIALTVLFGLFYMNPSHFTFAYLAGILAAVLIGAGGYVVNDYFDLPIDRVNRSDRMLPSGRMSPKAAYIYAIVLFVAGLQFSFLTGSFLAVGIALLNLLLLFFYARQLKTTFLIGNLSVAYASASTFIFGGIVANNFPKIWLVAAYAFTYTLIRELLKDLQDIEGDKVIKATTFAIKTGHRTTMAVNLVLALVMTEITWYGYSHDMLGKLQTMLLILFVHLPLIIATLLFFRHGNPRRYRILSLGMKLDMVILLLVIWFA